MTKFDAVLFDFGGVFTPSPFALIEAAALELGYPVEVVLATCFGGYDQDTDHPWHRLERGEVSIADALAAIAELAKEAGHDVDPIEVLSKGAVSEDGRIVREDVVEVVRDVRVRGLKTAIVTNNIKEYGTAWRELLPLPELFDLVVDSSEEGIRKPNPRIFELTLARLGDVAPHRAVFLDDAPGNVSAARSLGLHSIRVGPDYRPAVQELRDLLLA